MSLLTVENSYLFPGLLPIGSRVCAERGGSQSYFISAPPFGFLPTTWTTKSTQVLKWGCSSRMKGIYQVVQSRKVAASPVLLMPLRKTGLCNVLLCRPPQSSQDSVLEASNWFLGCWYQMLSMNGSKNKKWRGERKVFLEPAPFLLPPIFSLSRKYFSKSHCLSGTTN